MPASGKICFHATSAAENACVLLMVFLPNFRASEWENLFSRNERIRKCMCFINDVLPNFRASEWENLFSRNERRRKCGIYEINAELAQLVEQLIRNE